MNCYCIRQGSREDRAAAYYVCLKTGDHGGDGEPFYQDDPDALGRVFVGPYLEFESELSLILEGDQGICGYALGALDSKSFYARYDAHWRPALCAQYPMPLGEPSHWSRTQTVHASYHQPNYFCPQPYEHYPSHLHIDLLQPARGRGLGRRMVESILAKLESRGSRGVHLAVSSSNTPAIGFYKKLGFRELITIGSTAGGSVYMGLMFQQPA